MNNDLDLKNYWNDETRIKRAETSIKKEEEILKLKKENEKLKKTFETKKINLNYEKEEKNNTTNWILIQISINILLLILIFKYDFEILVIPFIFNYIIFWIYTIYKILKYDFKYNKAIWVLICIFLPFLAIFFPAFEDDIIIKQ
ncbi:MAG: hypothetical protein RBR70_10520 [Arcobacter sp.]|jgi:hypothetical protein|uniref:hypothetical protein n=1 Tax=Arcobacter sp. TaxID=1872629 RepID=UPI002A764884|nr:hypothetical protein [Arcobacter sp.]MDY3205493.1 hypothetical protein [Arcobacter sp.]